MKIQDKYKPLQVKVWQTGLGGVGSDSGRWSHVLIKSFGKILNKQTTAHSSAFAEYCDIAPIKIWKFLNIQVKYKNDSKTWIEIYYSIGRFGIKEDRTFTNTSKYRIFYKKSN